MIQLYKEEQKFEELFAPIRTNWNQLYYYNAFFDIWNGLLTRYLRFWR